jgi:phosphoserine phosphatase RsbU/P
MAATDQATESTLQRLARRASLYLLAPLFALLTLPVSVHILQKPDLGLALHRLQIQAVAPGGPAAEAGLRVGDRILAVDGRPVRRMVDWFTVTAGDYSLVPRHLTVDRDGRRQTTQVQPRRPSRSRMVFGLSIWLAGLAFLMIGWWVHLRRHDAVGRNFYGLCLIFAFFLGDVVDLPVGAYQHLKQLLRELLQYLWPVYFLRFFLMFPATGPHPISRGGRLLFLPAAALVAATLLAHAADVAEDSLAVGLIQAAALLHFVVFILIGLVVFARKVLRRDRPILHTKLRVILIGLVLGLLPFLVASAVGGGTLPQFPHWEYLGFSLLLVPVSFGLAIMRYGALDTAFVVRAGLIYGTVTLLILAAYVLGAGILGTWVAAVYQVQTPSVMVLIIAACSLAVLPLRRRVQGWVDAAFYPSRRANRAAVAELGRDLAGLVGADEAHDLLLDRLHRLYRPTRSLLYLASAAAAGHLHAVGRRPPTLPLGPPLPLDDPLALYLDRVRRPTFSEEFEDWGGAMAPAATRALRLQQNELLVPLITGNRLLGLLVLGPKDGGTLYSQEDLANLATLALQAAPLLESLRLHAETLRQRQLQTELNVAREIQAQLLPTEALHLAPVTIYGRNDPCRDVGGDYFDYFSWDEDRRLGFCIADVAGKGIPAALLMTTVRVTFRELALPGAAPEQVIAELDRRIGEILAPDRFISFFYGVLDLPRRLLTYCNAGLEPPLLLRRGGRTTALRRGGPILGIRAGVPYRRGTVRLEPGDLLIGYTDGITEQTSPDGREFFELERLQTMVAAAADLSAEALCDRIFCTVHDFGGDAASDDRTVIILKHQ